MKQPRITIKRDTIDWTMEIVGVVFLLLMMGLPIYHFSDLPETIPRHFNASGEPDGFGQRSVVWVLPVIGLILYIGMFVINRYPHIFNYPTEVTEENAERQYRMMTKMIRMLNVIVAGSFLYIVYQTIQTAVGGESGLGSWFLPLTILLTFGTIGAYVYRAIKVNATKHVY